MKPMRNPRKRAPTPHDVFISYSSQDKTVADAACAALEAREIRCWIAPRDVLVGTEYGEAIVNAIGGCHAMVLIFSGHANESPHIRREVERAVSKGKIIVPFRIENVIPSGALEYCLSNTHWLDALTPPLEKRIAELVTCLGRLLERGTREVVPPALLRELKEAETEKTRRVKSARTCLWAGWQISQLDLIWREHSLPITYSPLPIKDRADWESRVARLRQTHVIPDSQFDALLKCCATDKLGEEGGKLFFQFFGAIRMVETLNEIEATIQAITGVTLLPAFEEARRKARPDVFSPPGKDLVMGLIKTVSTATSPAHFSLLCFGFWVGSVTPWREVLEDEVGSQATAEYIPLIDEALKCALEFGEALGAPDALIQEIAAERRSLSQATVEGLQQITGTHAVSWMKQIESALPRLDFHRCEDALRKAASDGETERHNRHN